MKVDLLPLLLVLLDELLLLHLLVGQQLLLLCLMLAVHLLQLLLDGHTDILCLRAVGGFQRILAGDHQELTVALRRLGKLASLAALRREVAELVVGILEALRRTHSWRFRRFTTMPAWAAMQLLSHVHKGVLDNASTRRLIHLLPLIPLLVAHHHIRHVLHVLTIHGHNLHTRHRWHCSWHSDQLDSPRDRRKNGLRARSGLHHALKARRLTLLRLLHVVLLPLQVLGPKLHVGQEHSLSLHVLHHKRSVDEVPSPRKRS
mmetsp:Transcript_45211/g.105738  ORF Transcript_45211/g.105738 Transcript_45211/m.105738 type:complete len:260 (+) Transcript_45211:1344-2123(+)